MQSLRNRDSSVVLLEPPTLMHCAKQYFLCFIYDRLRAMAPSLQRLGRSGLVTPWNGGSIVAALMVFTLGCPVPTNFQKEPVPPNYPPVVDSSTTSFNQSEVVITNARPVWNLWVADANPDDTLRVKVVKDLHLALEAPLVTLLETSVFPTDVPLPEEDLPADLRTKVLELAYTPCPAGSEGSRPVLTVCLCDREFLSPTATQKNPCLPATDGYVTSYTVLVQCVAEP